MLRVLLNEMHFEHSHALADELFVDEFRVVSSKPTNLEIPIFDTASAIFPPNLRFVLKDVSLEEKILRENIIKHLGPARAATGFILRDGVDGWVKLVGRVAEEAHRLKVEQHTIPIQTHHDILHQHHHHDAFHLPQCAGRTGLHHLRRWRPFFSVTTCALVALTILCLGAVAFLIYQDGYIKELGALLAHANRPSTFGELANNTLGDYEALRRAHKTSQDTLWRLQADIANGKFTNPKPISERRARGSAIEQCSRVECIQAASDGKDSLRSVIASHNNARNHIVTLERTIDSTNDELQHTNSEQATTIWRLAQDNAKFNHVKEAIHRLKAAGGLMMVVMVLFVGLLSMQFGVDLAELGIDHLKFQTYYSVTESTLCLVFASWVLASSTPGAPSTHRLPHLPPPSSLRRPLAPTSSLRRPLSPSLRWPRVRLLRPLGRSPGYSLGSLLLV
ncbi:hypothetical protein CC86DRAFT_458794 [Ophiobolus disseminans]|uniref:Uncharacterized protein n=1 Tax=Ophiobolus disseminans TaxID=1469910 RepID=A0A6A6ZL84_9PLEO|nr:hypothetical protein CC86DRAFT_458794 [Ophiobolus disseminans]